jgi:deoxyribodipyrimidine photo-lyase
MWETDSLRAYKQTRNGLIGEGYSSRLSSWLALGSLSPRVVYAEIRRYERERVNNESTYWLFFELLWRDFFAFVAERWGRRIFAKGGVQGRPRTYRNDRDVFENWKAGRTGQPFVDANLRELAATGYMSNRGRQNAASYLAHDLSIDWRWGAAWVESALLD